MMNSVKKKHGSVRFLTLLLSFAIVFSTFAGGGITLSYAAENEGPAAGELTIASVEELTGGETQALYRDEVYKGSGENGEDPDKYYTTYREINLKDPRVFNFEFKVDADVVGDDTDAFLEKVSLQYGGLDLDRWVWDGYASSTKPKETSVLKIKDKQVAMNEDGTYTVCIAMETDTAWETSSQNELRNIPYDDYGAGRQFDFSTGQSADNRKWWQAGPLGKGVGTYEMTATIDGQTVAATDIHIAPYDGMHSWIEINEYAQSLIRAINGAEYPKSNFDGQTTGLIAAGYVGVDGNGNFVQGSEDQNVYVEVSILGYGLTDNEKAENQGFNNYARYNAIWNIVVAKDKGTVTSYLNETVPAMNTNPQELIDKIAAQKDDDIDLVQVYYQNNVHSDEVSGTDTMIKLTTDLIKGGKAGQDIAYKSWTLEDMDLNYRDPAEGANQGEDGHVVKGGYSADGRFMQENTRTDKVFSTKEALDHFIFVSTLCNNPDGKAGMRRTNRYAFDLNRDAVFSTMPETIALMNDIMKWDPLVENEWHGYVQQMLIEPCTAPHDPAYDYDLLQNTMLNLSYAAGLAATGSTGMQRFLVPWDHYDGGDWDDGGTVYSPMFAMLSGCYGFTIEFPYSNLDSLEANDVINYAMIDELLHGKTEFFSGNRLNGQLQDMDGNTYPSHEVDIKYDSMKKAALIGKLETKVRGLNNADAKETVDKYFIDKKMNEATGAREDKVVGRARTKDASGKELPFFPDYIVVPTDEANQYNVAEGIKAINQMLGWNIEVTMSTEAVTYGKTQIPAGAYVLDMKQARRNVVFEVMSKGYDATGFDDMYADIYCNLPDVRGFDSIQVYGPGLFDGKLAKVTSAEKKVNISGTEAEYVVFKSQSTDAVRFVNLLLSGYSSGPSTSEKGDVWMLRKSVDGVGNASDYIIKASDLAKVNNLTNNPVLGLNGCHIEGKYIAKLPEEAVALVEPVIQLNTVRTSQTGGTLWWMLDEYLGFKSMKDYNGSADLRAGANVIICNNGKLNSSMAEAVKKGTGVIFIRNAESLSDGILGTGSSAPTTARLVDVAISGKYNVDNSLFTENYATTSTYYARGFKFYDLPKGAKVLFQSDVDKDQAFIGGFQATKGEKDVFANAVTMFSTIIENEGKPAQALVLGQQLDYRSHYQKLLPMVATAIFANAAGILDDQNDPVIDAVMEGNKCVITAAEPDKGVAESGIEKLTVSFEKDGKDKLIEENTTGKVTFVPSENMTIKVVTADYAGNRVEKSFMIDVAKGTITEITPKPEQPPGGGGYLPGTGTTPKPPQTPGDPGVGPGTGQGSSQDAIIAGVKATTIKLRTIDAAKGYIKVGWTKSKGYKVDGYQVFRSVKRYSGYTKKAFFVKKTTSRTATYKNTKALKRGTRYYYKVRGYRRIAGKTYYTKWSNKAWWIAK